VRRAIAITRASWLTALSYRVETFFSFFAVVIAIVPLYLVSHALQPMMSNVIKGEAPHYFGFLVIGLSANGFVGFAINALHGALSSEISSGSFEALVSTPTRLPALLSGLVGQQFGMTALRQSVVLTLACVLGARLVWSGAPAALGILALTIFAYLPFGILAAALVLAFRTTGPFPGLLVTASTLFGGVYYPTSVIPSWLERFSALVPLAYGLRALRRTLLDGAAVSASAGDIVTLAATAVVLLAVSLIVFSYALRYAKHVGTLAQY
jgi:ABC-2 type transport system permease protein